MANGLRLKPGMQSTHSANQEFLKNIRSIQSTIEETLELLQKTKHRVERIFPRRGNALKKLCNRSRRFDSQCSFTERLDKPKDMIYYNRDLMKYHDAPNNKKNTVPGHDCYFAKLASFEEEYCEKGELHMEYTKMSCQEKNRKLCECCRATDILSPSPATQLHDPIPITANSSRLSLLTKYKNTTSGRKPDQWFSASSSTKTDVSTG